MAKSFKFKDSFKGHAQLLAAMCIINQHKSVQFQHMSLYLFDCINRLGSQWQGTDQSLTL